MENFAVLLEKPSDVSSARKYMRKLNELYSSGPEGTFGVLDSVIPAAADALAGVQRGFYIRDSDIMLHEVTPHQEQIVAERLRDIGDCLKVALLHWLSWECVRENNTRFRQSTILYDLYYALKRTLLAGKPLTSFSEYWGFKYDHATAYMVLLEVKKLVAAHQNYLARWSDAQPEYANAHYSAKLWPQYRCSEAEVALADRLAADGYTLSQVSATLVAVQDFFSGKKTDPEAFSRYWNESSLYGSDLLFGGYEYWEFASERIQAVIENSIELAQLSYMREHYATAMQIELQRARELRYCLL